MSKTFLAPLIVLAGVVTLTGCGPSYPDGPKKDTFVNGVEVFCGEGNYVVEDTSNRPLGGPTGLALGANCVENPTEASGFAARLERAFPGGEVVELSGSSAAFAVRGVPAPSGERLDRVSVYNFGDDGYEGPSFSTGYRLNDAS